MMKKMVPVISLQIVRGREVEALPVVRSPANALAMFSDWADADREHLLVLHLDARNHVIAVEVVGIGSLNETKTEMREIFKAAIVNNSASILLGHNHPGGDPRPSPEDVGFTRSVIEAGELLGIDVLDHLVIAGKNFVSLRERGEGLNWCV
jgi:DNA repair protein RadC